MNLKLPQTYRVTLGSPLLLRPAKLIGNCNTRAEARALAEHHVKLSGEKSHPWYDAGQEQEACEIVGREDLIFPRYLITPIYD
jgi:hypothetical protein